MEVLTQYLPSWLILILAVIGVITVVLKPISLLINISTSAKNWRSDFLDKRAKKTKFKKLKKAAIATKIEAIVNSTVFELQKELPQSWVKKMHLQWVTDKSIGRLKSGESIIRMEPLDRQDYNVINGVYHYFKETLFPETFEIVPERALNALSINLAHRTIKNGKSFLNKKFEETIMEREIQNDSDILKFIEPFENLDNRGFLTGAMVREINVVAENIRHKQVRTQFEDEILKMCGHMTEFTAKLPKAPDDLWYYKNSSHTYRFLLARNPGKLKVYVYLKRAQEAYVQEVDRLYVFGKNEDFKFTQKLIRRINSDTPFKHQETFNLDRDFKTNKKGIGALFTRE